MEPSRNCGKIPDCRLNMISLPPEIQQQVFQYLDQKSCHALALVHRNLTPSANVLLYQKPYFFSTYRFAQFVTTVAGSADHANLVRDLILMNTMADLTDNTKPNAGVNHPRLACWREWKYRKTAVWRPLPPPGGSIPTHPLAARFSRLDDKIRSTIFIFFVVS